MTLTLFIRATPETETELAGYRLMGRDTMDGGEISLRKFDSPAALEAAVNDLRSGVELATVLERTYDP